MPRLFVGASLLAKNSQAPRSIRKHALSLTFFASKLAPTGVTKLQRFCKNTTYPRNHSLPRRYPGSCHSPP
ncbi:hypothetical protein BFW90_00135 [Pseudomonas fluorescens]|uniref:Uncharacterized protein n=1 Tax=Pseudomonas azotoformans TaxID=47878 RepID=A0A4Q0I095_PSEAZ|nr:hypothetical protein BFW90_00135 [Pseudomonas fluorescens]RXE54542.1 hypothetical protein B4O85_00075 [Pseudomonas azotoformans]